MKIKGGDLMLFVNGKSIAFATSHTLSISADTIDTSNKDEGGGDWADSEVGKLSWTCQSENMYADTTSGVTQEELMDLMANKTVIDAVFAPKKEATVDVPETGWTPNGGRKGKMIITKIDINAKNGEYATYTVEFTGKGKLAKVNAAG